MGPLGANLIVVSLSFKEFHEAGEEMRRYINERGICLQKGREEIPPISSADVEIFRQRYSKEIRENIVQAAHDEMLSCWSRYLAEKINAI